MRCGVQRRWIKRYSLKLKPGRARVCRVWNTTIVIHHPISKPDVKGNVTVCNRKRERTAVVGEKSGKNLTNLKENEKGMWKGVRELRPCISCYLFYSKSTKLPNEPPDPTNSVLSLKHKYNINQSINQATNHSINQATDNSISQSINQSNEQSFNQSINRPSQSLMPNGWSIYRCQNLSSSSRMAIQSIIGLTFSMPFCVSFNSRRNTERFWVNLQTQKWQ